MKNLGEWLRERQERRAQRKMYEMKKGILILLDGMTFAANQIAAYGGVRVANSEVWKARHVIEACLPALQRAVPLCEPAFQQEAIRRIQIIRTVIASAA